VPDLPRTSTKREPPAPLAEDPDRLLTFAEGIAFLGIGRRLGWSLCNTGELPHLRIGRLIRFRRAALIAWAEAHEQKERRR
jgi:excisionase family DNA binding protein